MKRLRIYDIVLESGVMSLNDVVLYVNDDFNHDDIFPAVEKNLDSSVDSYRYEEIV